MKIKRCRRLEIPPNNILFPVIWITNKCNLQCKMCDQWKTDEATLSDELSTQEWYSFIDSTNRMQAAVIVITGGEPLLRTDIFEVIKYIEKNGIACHLCTNGTMLNETIVSKLRESGLNSISISLDSDYAEIHNELRGIDCFDIVVKGIKLLRETIPELKIGINYLITRRNFHDMDRMVFFAESLGVDQIKFDIVHTNLMHRKKSLSSFGDILFTRDDLLELTYEIDKLICAASRTKLLTNSSTFIKGVLNFYNGQPNRLCCYAGYISCAIDAFGRVSPCDNFDGDENLRDKPLEEIWRSPSFQRLRQRAHNCTSNCWDSTHTELNIRCSKVGFIKEFGQILKEIHFYLT